ncbi:alpha/beta fold hydrolase [Tropicimonas aquimaris]|uniref:Alpha/beta fold hydrolase n=1 Tax=Tropicimonas aquimaris TaxID=914152 RepID=A0ABW3INV1_9RHOB
MTQAPFYHGIAAAPEGAEAVWVVAPDGVRLRLALLAPPPADCRGTVLLFTGRTEFVEKYGPAAAELQARGYASVTLDWRGQGLSDRQLDDPATGHVSRFSEYQLDVAELVRFARAKGLPEPFFLLAHSMGGAIGLRALHERLPVDAVAFSAPMWGIKLHPATRPFAGLITASAHVTGFGSRYAPSTKPVTYVLDAPFENNTLTTDPEMFAWMRRQVEMQPELALGGPSMTWLNEAFREGRRLRRLPPPATPCITWMGSNERIVEISAIRRLMADWSGGTLSEVPGAEHELMMEPPPIRSAFFDACAALFDTRGGAA